MYFSLLSAVAPAACTQGSSRLHGMVALLCPRWRNPTVLENVDGRFLASKHGPRPSPSPPHLCLSLLVLLSKGEGRGVRRETTRRFSMRPLRPPRGLPASSSFLSREGGEQVLASVGRLAAGGGWRRREWGRGNKSVEQEAESQRIVALGYSTPYNTPFRFKSSAKDLSPQTFGIDSRWTYAVGGTRGPSICSRVTSGEVSGVASSMASDLEAFSHNPTHGSFAPLAFQPSAITNYVNQRFLSY